MRTTTILVATMETAHGDVVLEEVGIDAAVDDLMAAVSVCQRYRNPGTTHVEAVYTFPLPLDAVLLQFELELGDRRMAGTVIAKPDAEERYENAIAEGDAAVRLEQSQPGLYTANVGNLAPGETATVRFRYGLLLRWNGDTVRLMLPTTIAPRYGDPAAGGLAPHQAPEYAFDAERSFRLQAAVRGALQGARWASPSHDIAVTPDTWQTVIEIARPAAMDRDVVLEARAAAAVDTGDARALLARDGGGWVVLASFRPELTDLTEPAAHRNLKIVVDCSGSMSGDSIAQVRIAGERILESLRPGDLFDIVAFGSRHRALFGRETPASAANVARARRFVSGLDADMGGTEIQAALRAAYRIAGEPGMTRDLLLITDGEVWQTRSAVDEARRSGHRIFTVGVGSSVAEPFVRALAKATGGACELVAPREDMAERIHRHFQRILAPPARTARVVWPAPVRQTVPDPLPPPYPGDTMHLFGSFAERPCGPVTLELELADGRTLTQRMEVVPEPTDDTVDGPSAVRSDVARMGAAQRLPAMADGAAATELAVRYQLLSEWTDYLVVHVRAEADKATDLPSLVKVPQVLAAGWHGIGTVLHDRAEPRPSASPRPMDQDVGEPLCEYRARPSAGRSDKSRRGTRKPASGARARRRRSALPSAEAERRLPDASGSGWVNQVGDVSDAAFSPAPHAITPAITPVELVAALNERPLPAAPTLDDLLARGVPDEIVDQLRELADGGGEDPSAIAIIFLYLLCRSSAGKALDAQQRRSILAAYRKLSDREATVRAVRRVWREWEASGAHALP